MMTTIIKAVYLEDFLFLFLDFLAHKELNNDLTS